MLGAIFSAFAIGESVDEICLLPVHGMTGFGASAPIEDLYKHFGITAEAVVAAVEKKLA